MKKILMISLCLLINACSFSDSKKDDDPTVRADDLEFAVDTLDDSFKADPMQVEPEKVAQTRIPDEFQEPVAEEPAMLAPIEPTFSEFDNKRVDQFVPIDPFTEPAEIVIAPKEMTMTGTFETYQVQKGDTLMMVAFKIYGDYRKWKELRDWNQDKIHAKLTHGMVLKYQIPGEKFGWMPSGLPYLVKTGDTLQVISMDKYGTTRKWKSIYENNRPLIRDSNLIFAGFTLYYQPSRDLASEPR